MKPPWCYTRLDLHGNECDLKTFADDMTAAIASPRVSEQFTFSLIAPVPTGIEELSEVEDWCVENWGTRWDTLDAFRIAKDSSLTYTFRTPWTFPESALGMLAEKYPNLSFEASYIFDGEDAATFVPISRAK